MADAHYTPPQMADQTMTLDAAYLTIGALVSVGYFVATYREIHPAHTIADRTVAVTIAALLGAAAGLFWPIVAATYTTTLIGNNR